MSTFFITLLVFMMVITAMSVGVIFKRKPIQGSCGGLGAVGLGGKCDFCEGDTEKCKKKSPPE